MAGWQKLVGFMMAARLRVDNVYVPVGVSSATRADKLSWKRQKKYEGREKF